MIQIPFKLKENSKIQVLAALIKMKGDCLKLEYLSCLDCPFSHKDSDNPDSPYLLCPYRLDDNNYKNMIVDPEKILAAVYDHMNKNNISIYDIFEVVL